MTLQALRDAFTRIGQHFHDPDYYQGPFAVVVDANGRSMMRRCRNYATARAWCHYLSRRGFTFAEHRLSVCKLS
jgi:hypothetical protein